jgi:hypothetical protein
MLCVLLGIIRFIIVYYLEAHKTQRYQHYVELLKYFKDVIKDEMQIKFRKEESYMEVKLEFKHRECFKQCLENTKMSIQNN